MVGKREINRIGILVFDDVEELDAVGPYQVFGTARSEFPESFHVSLIAQSAEAPVRCVNGLRILPDHDFGTAPALDVLVIPGGIGTRRVAVDRHALEWIRATVRRCRWVASVCTGARITFAAGLADGKRITTHWSAIEELRATGRAQVLDDVRFVRDGNVIHSAGVSAGIDMALWLVGELAQDPLAARKVQKMLEYYPAPPYAYLA
jgi:transcriptional regulator GlxA family with amidase domain